MDKEKLVKVLNLTTSDNDGEALAAIRAANSMLIAANATWADLFAPSPTVSIVIKRETPKEKYDAYVQGDREDWTPPHLTDKPVIEQMFRTVYASSTPGTEFHDFLNSIHEKFTKHGNLTQGQYQALRRAYGRTNSQYRTR